MKKEFIPGWLFMAALGALSVWLSRLVIVGGKHPLEASALVVILGMAARNFIKLPEFLYAGIRVGEKILILGIVLMGASLDFGAIWSQGIAILGVILLTMTVGFVVTFLVARFLQLSQALSLLLAVGTTICGGTAVAVTAPLIQARDEETSSAVTVIALWGVVGLLVYPALAKWLGVGDFAFGLFAGTAIHSTPQVVGAGFIYSALAGKTATAIKLVRNCFIAPMAMIMSWMHHRSNHDTTQLTRAETMRSLARAFPWFLFAFFIMIWIRTQGYISATTAETMSDSGRFLIVVGMAAVGLGTAFNTFKKTGYKPALVGLIGAVVVAGVSVIAITLFT